VIRTLVPINRIKQTHVGEAVIVFIAFIERLREDTGLLVVIARRAATAHEKGHGDETERHRQDYAHPRARYVADEIR
jgi:hypothetical protein